MGSWDCSQGHPMSPSSGYPEGSTLDRDYCSGYRSGYRSYQAELRKEKVRVWRNNRRALRGRKPILTPVEYWRAECVRLGSVGDHKGLGHAQGMYQEAGWNSAQGGLAGETFRLTGHKPDRVEVELSPYPAGTHTHHRRWRACFWFGRAMAEVLIQDGVVVATEVSVPGTEYARRITYGHYETLEDATGPYYLLGSYEPYTSPVGSWSGEAIPAGCEEEVRRAEAIGPRGP